MAARCKARLRDGALELETRDEALIHALVEAPKVSEAARRKRSAAEALGTVEVSVRPGFGFGVGASDVSDLLLVKKAVQADAAFSATFNSLAAMEAAKVEAATRHAERMRVYEERLEIIKAGGEPGPLPDYVETGLDMTVFDTVRVSAPSWTFRAFGVGDEDAELAGLATVVGWAWAWASNRTAAHANDARGLGMELDFGMLELETPLDIEIDDVGIPLVPLATIVALDVGAGVKALLARARIAQLRAARAPGDDRALRPCPACGASFDKRALLDHVLQGACCDELVSDDAAVVEKLKCEVARDFAPGAPRPFSKRRRRTDASR